MLTEVTSRPAGTGAKVHHARAPGAGRHPYRRRVPSRGRGAAGVVAAPAQAFPEWAHGGLPETECSSCHLSTGGATDDACTFCHSGFKPTGRQGLLGLPRTGRRHLGAFLAEQRLLTGVSPLQRLRQGLPDAVHARRPAPRRRLRLRRHLPRLSQHQRQHHGPRHEPAPRRRRPAGADLRRLPPLTEEPRRRRMRGLPRRDEPAAEAGDLHDVPRRRRLRRRRLRLVPRRPDPQPRAGRRHLPVVSQGLPEARRRAELHRVPHQCEVLPPQDTGAQGEELPELPREEARRQERLGFQVRFLPQGQRSQLEAARPALLQDHEEVHLLAVPLQGSARQGLRGQHDLPYAATRAGSTRSRPYRAAVSASTATGPRATTPTAIAARPVIGAPSTTPPLMPRR